MTGTWQRGGWVAAAVGMAALSWQCAQARAERSAVDGEALRALVAVRAHADSATAARVDPAVTAQLPPLEAAVATLLGDRTPGADARRRRALAGLVAGASEAAASRELRDRLGVDPAAVRRVVAGRYPADLIGDYDASRSRREFVVMRALADDPGTLAGLDAEPDGWFAALLGGSGSGSLCWRPEAPSSVQFIDPAVTIQTYVSVNGDVGTGGKTFQQVKENVDPQRWDDCSPFWSPPPDGTYLAVVARPTPPGCQLQPSDLVPASPNPATSPGAPSYQGTLFERFHCTTIGCDAWFENLLNVSAVPDRVPYPAGTPLPSHLVSYWIADCGNGQQNGYIAGEILGLPTRVILDEGWLEAWQQDGRTHIKTFKKVQFGGPTNTWIAANILGFTELSDEMGALACCEP